jgi:hypothetical protein
VETEINAGKFNAFNAFLRKGSFSSEELGWEGNFLTVEVIAIIIYVFWWEV